MQIRELKEKIIAIIIAAVIMAGANIYTHTTSAVWHISGDADYSNDVPKTLNEVEQRSSYVPNLSYLCKYVPSSELC